MARVVDSEARKRAILAATINSYIKDAEPISSEDIAEKFDLSSATIRSIFADLENNGYLTHPHTSAGRVPTGKGYRYYVDFLLSQIELLADEKQRIIKEIGRRIDRLEDALEHTSEAISAITHYTSMVSFLEWQDKLFYKGISLVLEEPEFRDSTRIRLLVKMIEDKQKLLKIINRDFKEKEKVRVYIGDELECDEMKNCALIVSHYTVHKQPLGRIAVLGPARMKYDHIIPTMEYVSQVLSDILDDF